MNKKTALTFLLIGTMLFGLGPPVLKLLASRGGSLGLEHPGAISFCNVLFVGNLCAGLLTLVFHGAIPLLKELSGLSRSTKGYLLIAAILSTIYPALLFTALENTTVISIVLLSRFNGMVHILLSFLVFGTRVNRFDASGYAIIGLGVMVLVLLNNGFMQVQKGDLLVLAATLFYAATEFISKKILETTTIHAYVFFRNFVSAAIFFFVAIYLYGSEHFAEAFQGELWTLMALYAGVAVVGAQACWLVAVRVIPIVTVANVQLLNPPSASRSHFSCWGSFRAWWSGSPCRSYWPGPSSRSWAGASSCTASRSR